MSEALQLAMQMAKKEVVLPSDQQETVVIHEDGTKVYRKGGLLHRDAGPAIESPDGSGDVWRDGKYLYYYAKEEDCECHPEPTSRTEIRISLDGSRAYNLGEEGWLAISIDHRPGLRENAIFRAKPRSRGMSSSCGPTWNCTLPGRAATGEERERLRALFQSSGMPIRD